MKHKTFLCPYAFFACVVFSMNASLYADEPAVADPGTYFEEVIQILKTDWPKNRTVNIVAHGHSVPAGYFATPKVDTFNAYPHLFHKALKEQYPNAVINVIVTAIGGEKSDRGAARFEKYVLMHHPDVVFIDYGLNDRRIGLEKAKKAWDAMILSAKKSGAKVILFTPTGDSRANLNDPKDPLNQHAEQIRKLAAEHHVALVDSLALYKKHIDDGGEMTDLLSQVNHPNRKGHDLVVEKLMLWFPKESSTSTTKTTNYPARSKTAAKMLATD